MANSKNVLFAAVPAVIKKNMDAQSAEVPLTQNASNAKALEKFGRISNIRQIRKT